MYLRELKDQRDLKDQKAQWELQDQKEKEV